MKCEAAVPFIERDHEGSFPANGTPQYLSLRVPARRSESAPRRCPRRNCKGPNARISRLTWSRCKTMPTLCPSTVSQSTMITTNFAGKQSSHISKQINQNTKMPPRNLQLGHISMPGPNATADTEIGRLFLLFFGTASSMPSLSPAQISNNEHL